MLLSLAMLSSCTSSKPENSRAYSNAFSPKNVKRIDADEAPFIAGKSGRVYHTRYCQYAAAIKDPAGYKTSHDAAIKGLIPCEFCNPQSQSSMTPPVARPRTVPDETGGPNNQGSDTNVTGR